MFTLISWQQYWYAAAALTSTYYTVVIFLYYRTEVLALFSGKRPSRGCPELNNDPSVMGKIIEDQNHSYISSEELQFNPESDHIQ